MGHGTIYQSIFYVAEALKRKAEAKDNPPINSKYKEYLRSLGFSEEQIDQAWAKCLNKYPQYKDQIDTLEIITRDILQGREQ
jgi:hypothetical protein